MHKFIKSDRVFPVLLLIIGVLVGGHCLGQVSRFVFGRGHVWGLVDLFHLEYEFTPAAFFSGSILLGAGVLMFVYSHRLRRLRVYRSRCWAVLGLIFLYLACDEVFSFHEYAHRLLSVEDEIANHSFPYWTVVAMIVVAGFVLVFGRFWWTMESGLRRRVAIAAAIYVSGAVGVEIISFLYANALGAGLGYNLVVAVEESMEMLGVALLIRALLRHMPLRPESAPRQPAGAQVVADQTALSGNRF